MNISTPRKTMVRGLWEGLLLVFFMVLLATTAMAAELRILPLGNSITHGYKNHDSYRRSLWHKLNDAGYEFDFIGSMNTSVPNPDFDLDHEGHNGWKTGDLRDELSGWLSEYTPDIVLLHAGTNDMGRNIVDEAIENLEAIIDIFRKDNPNVIILIAQIIPARDFNRNLRTIRLNEGISVIASEKSTPQSPVILVDQYSDFDTNKDLFDNLHPSESGEEKMAQKWFDALKPVLVDETAPGIVNVWGGNEEESIIVVFSESVDEESAEEISNYRIDNGIDVTGAELSENLNRVKLTTSPLEEEATYVLSVSGVMDRASPPNEAHGEFSFVYSASGRVSEGQQVLYTFEEGKGSVVHDVSGSGEPVDLNISNSDAVSWVSDGLSVNSQTEITSPGPAGKVIEACRRTNEITVEAWVVPANTSQKGPARMVTLSMNASSRHFTLGQMGSAYNMRLRTTETNLNGRPPLQTSSGTLSSRLTHVVYTRDASGFAKIYLDGEEKISRYVGGNFSNWNTGYHLGLANEMTGDRPWLGELHLVAVYSRALNAEEVDQNFRAGADGALNEPPEANITVDITSETAPLTVEFDGTGSRDEDGSVVSHDWDFGDGETGEGATVSHEYVLSGPYTVTLTVTDDKGATNTATQVIDVKQAPVAPGITSQPQNRTVNEGQEVSLSLVATGTEPLRYQWRRGETEIPGATGAAYLIASADMSYNGAIFTCVVKNEMGSVTSDEAVLAVVKENQRPLAHISADINEGTAPLTVKFDGTGSRDDDGSVVSHDWEFGDGETGAGATVSHEFDRSGIHIVRLTVTDDDGATNTATQVIVVTPELMVPGIMSHPQNRTVHEGQEVSLRVVATGTEPLRYQWQRGETEIPGATGTAYLIAAADMSHNGASFTCVVSNKLGSVTSNKAVLTVMQGLPRVTEGQQVLYTFEEGEGAAVHDVSGSGEPIHLNISNKDAVSWVSGGLSINASTMISSPDAAAKVIEACSETNEITMEAWVVPANASQKGPARMVTLSMNASSRNFTLGQMGSAYNMRLRTTATNLNGRPPLQTSSGTLSSRLSHVVYTRDASGLAKIYVDGEEKISRNVGGDFSNWNTGYHLGLANELTGGRPWLGELHLVAVYNRALNAEEVDQNFRAGADGALNEPPEANITADNTLGTAPLTVEFDGTGSRDEDGSVVSHDWDFGDGETGEGATVSHEYVLSGPYTVTLTVTDDKGATSSTTVVIDLKQAPVAPGITSQPQNRKVNKGQEVSLSLVATGTEPLLYQWRRGETEIPGATGAAYLIASADMSYNGAIFTCVVKNEMGSVTSDEAVLAVVEENQRPLAHISADINEGTAPLTVKFDGTGSRDDDGSVVSHDWEFGDGETGAGATVSHEFDGSGTYTVTLTVTDDDGAANTATQVIVVNPAPVAPVITSHPQSLMVNKGQEVSLSVVATGTEPLRYQWRRGETKIPGATGAAYLIAAADMSHNGAIFTCVVTNGVGSVTSSEALLTVVEGLPRVTEGQQVLYTFEEGEGAAVHDVSGSGEPINLNISNKDAVSWVSGGLSINASTMISSPDAAAKVIEACSETNEITMEAWVVPANTTQKGPARMVTLSVNTSSRNFTLGQMGSAYNMRLRTTKTSGNGRPPLQTSSGTLSTQLTHVVYTRDASGLAKIYVDGVEKTSRNVGGDFSNWNTGYHLGLGNEMNGRRPWLGELHLVAIYNRALNSKEVDQNFRVGANTGQ